MPKTTWYIIFPAFQVIAGESFIKFDHFKSTLCHQWLFPYLRCHFLRVISSLVGIFLQSYCGINLCSSWHRVSVASVSRSSYTPRNLQKQRFFFFLAQFTCLLWVRVGCVSQFLCSVDSYLYDTARFLESYIYIISI